jgi:xanthine dehydrogenase accessory factor
MTDIPVSILNYFNHYEPIVLVTLLTTSGSTPRKSGAQMIVLKGGESFGSIGGGQMEFDVIQECMLLYVTNKTRIKHFSMSGESAADLGMICGGQADVLMEYLDPLSESVRIYYTKLVEILDKRTPEINQIVEIYPSDVADSVKKSIQTLHGEVLYSILNTLDFDSHKSKGNNQHIIPSIFQPRCIIFGGGHIGQKLAPLVTWVGFSTIVVDDRLEFINPGVEKTLLTMDYREIFDTTTIDHNTFIVIVTRGHLNDQVVLERALASQAGYIGMIGSKRKCLLVFDDLLKKNFDEKAIQRIHAPIGLQIGAQTPEEIAICIAAEMILFRNMLK